MLSDAGRERLRASGIKGGSRPKPKGPKCGEEILELVRGLLAEGFTEREIADRIGRASSTVHDWRRWIRRK